MVSFSCGRSLVRSIVTSVLSLKPRHSNTVTNQAKRRNRRGTLNQPSRLLSDHPAPSWPGMYRGKLLVSNARLPLPLSGCVKLIDSAADQHVGVIQRHFYGIYMTAACKMKASRGWLGSFQRPQLFALTESRRDLYETTPRRT